MKVPLSWLRDYVDWPWEPKELARRLTMAGVNIETVERVGEGLSGVIAARVESVEPHPGAPGALWVAEVETGAGLRRVVAGIANMRPGDIVPYAPPGSVLPGGWRIEARTLHGVVSEGMLLSLSELVLGEKPREGEVILVLPPDTTPGADAAGLLGLPEDVLVLDLTPNYATHCQSVIGVAREVAALTGVGPAGVRRPESGLEGVTGGPEAAGEARVTIEAPDLCPRYIARLIRGVKLAPSPAWMQLRVLAAGMRPINNIVDVTNYVMLEYGQPLHAFDLEDVAGRHIVVRRAREGERMVTLDGVERRLTSEMLVIADEARAVAVAGVMGGLSSEVNPETTDVLLESAHFHAGSVRRTSSRLGLVSEASSRFDKGADPGAVDPASARAAALIATLSGGAVAPGAIDAHPRPFEARQVTLRPERAAALIGAGLPASETRHCLELLGFEIEEAPGGEGGLTVTVPSWRADVEREIDLVEEVARVYGYDRVEPTLPQGVTTVGRRPAGRRLADRARQALVGAGFSEVVLMSLADRDVATHLAPARVRPLVLANPLAENQSALRTGLLGGLLGAVARNLSYAERTLRLFEVGMVYWPRGDELRVDELVNERPYLAAVACGAAPEGLGPAAGWEPDFFYMKGVAENLLRALGVETWRFERGEDSRFHPGRQAALTAEGPGGETVELGVIGELHPEVVEGRDVEDRVTALELDLEAVLQVSTFRVRFRVPPRHPAVFRDVAVVLPEEVEVAAIERIIRQAAGELCEAVRLFDIYRGRPVPEGHRSTAWRVTYRSPERSLTDAEVDEVHGRVRRELERVLGATLR